ncbi:MAG TPA: gamma carbonic anhydrase family protein [Thermoplasmatales archaeon]|nr:gamma carbonic anhydrase family protein [Thermoplasmatales archaeon]HEB37542.1 gamma carbonic anhydrase family protein [Thermoplasmatales archaeon]
MQNMKPKIDPSCYIAPSAVIIGDVTLEKECSVFPNAVIRGDENTIEIGECSNIQDCCVIHTDKEHTVTIGKYVTLGHGAIVHGATIEDDCIIGMHATVLNGAKIGRGSIIGANALVTENMEVPENSLVLGIPGKVVKTNEKFREMARKNAEEYLDIARRYKKGIIQH